MSEVDPEKKQVEVSPRVISEAAHEGRNTLQELQAGLDLLRVLLEDHAEALEILREVARPEGRLRRLFDDLEDYWSPITVEQQACDLPALWHEVRARLVGERSPTDLEACHVRADPQLLEKVFHRTLRFLLEAGSRPEEIEVHCSRAESRGRPMILLALRDTAAPEPHRERTSKTPTLGLAIVERLVEAQGGHLEIHSPPDGGKEIHLFLPPED